MIQGMDKTNASLNRQPNKESHPNEYSVSQITSKSPKNKLLITTGIFFVIVIFGVGGYFLGKQSLGEKQKDKNTVIEQDTTSDNLRSICTSPKLPNANNTQTFSEWKNPFVDYEDGKIIYREVNVSKDIVCKYVISLPDNVKKPSNFHLHIDEPYISYIDYLSKDFHIRNIYLGSEKVIPLFKKGFDSSGSTWTFLTLYYDNSFYKEGKLLGSIIIIVPKLFYGGCEYGGCEELELKSKKHWEESDVQITIIRTDGSYFKINRNELPYNFDFNDYDIDRVSEKLIFNTKKEYRSFSFDLFQ